MISRQISRDSLPQTTLVILLGASEWPRYPQFQASEALKQAPKKIEEYFTKSFGIPQENILPLFNTDLNAVEIGDEINRHLEKFKGTAKDIIVYCVSHAQRTAKHRQLYLIIKSTQERDPEGTSLKIENLIKAVVYQTRNLRHFYIFDCCFAADAIPDLQGYNEIDLLHTTLDEEEIETKTGYVALFSSGKSKASLMLPDHTNTYFTEALLQRLLVGIPCASRNLSFRDVYNIINTDLENIYKKNISSSSRPPDAQIYGGDLANTPIFPNPAFGHDSIPPNSNLAPVTDPADEVLSLMHKFNNQEIPGDLFGVKGTVKLDKFTDLYKKADVYLDSEFYPEAIYGEATTADLYAMASDTSTKDSKKRWVVKLEGYSPKPEVVQMLHKDGNALAAKPWLIVFGRIAPEIRTLAKKLKVLITGIEEWRQLEGLFGSSDN